MAKSTKPLSPRRDLALLDWYRIRETEAYNRWLRGGEPSIRDRRFEEYGVRAQRAMGSGNCPHEPTFVLVRRRPPISLN